MVCSLHVTHLWGIGVEENNMNFLSFAILTMLILAHGFAIEVLEATAAYPIEQEERIVKREVSDAKSQKKFHDFVEEKLIQHTQALEHLIKLVDEAVGALNSLAENLGGNFEEPRLPEKVEAQSELQERSGNNDESRRFYWGKGWGKSWGKLSNFYNFKTTSSPWCSVAVLCHRTRMTVCGYDDNFGYGKFDDLCHLIQVNCYWKYNFALVPDCRKTL